MQNYKTICRPNLEKKTRCVGLHLQRRLNIIMIIMAGMAGAEDLPLKTTTSLFAGVFVIARSSREQLGTNSAVITDTGEHSRMLLLPSLEKVPNHQFRCSMDLKSY